MKLFLVERHLISNSDQAIVWPAEASVSQIARANKVTTYEILPYKNLLTLLWSQKKTALTAFSFSVTLFISVHRLGGLKKLFLNNFHKNVHLFQSFL